MLSVGSLFSGIGGFDLGLERAGMRVLWQCEADDYCRRVLARHWPDVPCYPDVRELAGTDVAPVDVLCGGFPCQDISSAGKQAGIDGARSGLWSEYARLIGELRPRYVVVENVADLLVRGFGRVLGDLAALGYDAEWDCLPASAFGAPHRRDRVWLIAYAGGQQHEGASPAQRRSSAPRLPEAHPDAHGGRQQERPQLDSEQEQGTADRDSRWRHADGLGDEVADPASTRLEGSGLPGRPPVSGTSLADADELGRDGWSGQQRPAGWREPADSGWWATEPDVGRVANGVPGRVDRLRGLGNALVPQIAEWIGWRILEWERVADVA